MAYELIKSKRAIRAFSTESIAQSLIQQIANAGRLAQSSKNDQPWTFIIIQDPNTLTNLSKCGRYAGHLAGATFAIAIAARPGYNFDVGQAASYLQLSAWEHGIGSCIASIHDMDTARTLLQVPSSHDLKYALSFGYPKDKTSRVARKSGRKGFETVVKFEHW